MTHDSALPVVTGRLMIRPLTSEDEDAMHRVFCDPRVMQFIPGGATDRNGTRARLRSLIEHQNAHGFSKWAVVTHAEREVIGDRGLQYLDNGPEIELGFHIARERWGHGYAGEAARACLAWARARRPEPIVAVIDPANSRSHKTLCRIGMRPSADETCSAASGTPTSNSDPTAPCRGG
jgi:ribosomal-protein-alanine N-acetyltransferase